MNNNIRIGHLAKPLRMFHWTLFIGALCWRPINYFLRKYHSWLPTLHCNFVENLVFRVCYAAGILSHVDRLHFVDDQSRVLNEQMANAIGTLVYHYDFLSSHIMGYWCQDSWYIYIFVKRLISLIFSRQ